MLTMRRRQRKQQKKTIFARAAHFFCTFLCHCFARRQRETSRNFLVTRLMEEMLCGPVHWTYVRTIFSETKFLGCLV